MKLSSKSSQKYNYLYKILMIFGLVILPSILIWILIGEFNLLHNNWLVGHNSNWYWALRTDPSPGPEDSSGAIWAYWIYSFGPTLFNPLIFAFIGAQLALIILVFALLVYFQKIEIIFLTQILSIFTMMVILIISGLWYGASWVGIIRAIIVVSTYGLAFVFFNFIINKIIINFDFTNKLLVKMMKQDEENAKFMKENSLKIKKTKPVSDFVEIEE